MKIIIWLLAFVISIGLAFGVSIALGQDWKSSPYNYDNSPYNYKNSPYNYDNSPYNYKNSPLNRSRENGIYDEKGNSRGYVTPKSGGGFNIFDNEGNRIGYKP